MKHIFLLMIILFSFGIAGSYAELPSNDTELDATWATHEYPNTIFPIQYTHNECTVSIWSDASQMVLQAYDSNWYRKKLLQIVTLKRLNDGSIQRVDHRFEKDTGPKAHGLELEVLGYDVFGERCLAKTKTLPDSAREIFGLLYRPNER